MDGNRESVDSVLSAELDNDDDDGDGERERERERLTDRERAL